MEALAAMLEEDTSDGGVTVGDWAVGEASSGGQKSREPPIPVGPGVCHAPPWLWKNELIATLPRECGNTTCMNFLRSRKRGGNAESDQKAELKNRRTS